MSLKTLLLSKKVLFYFFLVILISSSVITVVFLTLSPNYTSIDPIKIESDSELKDYSVSGSGTKDDPFKIERYKIVSSEDFGIRISGTTKYFIITNCYIDVNAYGILISSTAKETVSIKDNTCISSYYGIYLYNTTGTIVSENVCKKEKEGNYIWWFGMQFGGIYLNKNTNTTVSKNSCLKMYDFGIFMESCNEMIVVENTCEDVAGYGIYASRSFNVTITNNLVKNNIVAGIGSANNEFIIIAENKFKNNGFTLNDMWQSGYDFSTLQVFDNTINGKKLGFFYNLTSSVIEDSDYGQIILCECTDVTVKNQVFENLQAGISLINSTGLCITQNQFINCGNGIYSIFTSNSSFTYNICNSNSNAGIFLDYYCSSIFIDYNDCKNNGYGIYLWYSSLCNMKYNLLVENTRFGVYINMNSKNNSVHHNTFVGNHQEVIHYFESSQAIQWELDYPNFWYDILSNEGNYWSDWSGTGYYKIDSPDGDLYDFYPLLNPSRS